MTAVHDNAQLTTIAREILTKKGYEDVEAEFSPFADFKVKWARSYGWISFEISDYMQGADEAAIRDLFKTISEKIAGHEAHYSSNVIDWISNGVRCMWDTFVRRHHGYINEALNDILGDLQRDGWIHENGFRIFLSSNRERMSPVFNVAILKDSEAGYDDRRRKVFEAWLNCSIPFDTDESERKETIRRELERYDAAN